MPRALVALFALPFAVAVAPAQPKEDPLDRVTFRLTTTPAAAPTPALKYQLRTPANERLPGNAALDYYRAAVLRPKWPSDPKKGEALLKDQDRWMEVELDQLPVQDVTAYLDQYAEGFIALDAGARRDVVDWRQGVKLEPERLTNFLDEIHPFTEISRLNRYRVRRDLARNQFDDAALALRSGFRLGKAVGEGPVVIQMLVGINICQRAVGGCNDFIGRPGSPNLYWALGSLPRPLVDPRPALEGEEEFMERGYRAQGPFPKDAADAHHAFMDELRRAFTLPYPKATAELDTIAAREAERSTARGEPAEQGYAAVVPMIGKCYHAHARLDRRMAGLMAVEAVRLHAAGAQGTPPAALADITAVAVPPDPFTGRPFEYAARPDGFTLTGPEDPNRDAPGSGFRYVVTFRR